jgi:mycothione reductase
VRHKQSNDTQDHVKRFALAVIGSGSGNVVIPDDLGRGNVALIESGSFGGTCINRGCIPTKMFVYTADLATQVRDAPEFGLETTLAVDWPAIRDRIISKVDETSLTGRKEREQSTNVVLFNGHARFASPEELVINDETHIRADQFVIATGTRPSIPPIVAESGVEFYTSDTIMRVEDLPASMVILGGGYVAVELAHVFGSLGVEVHIVEKAATLMESLDAEIAERFTAQAASRWEVHLNAVVTEVRQDAGGISVVLGDGRHVRGELLLVATGRRPNTDDLCLDLAGVGVNDDGRIEVDRFGRAAPGIWALGDCSSPFELKHVANAEARAIAHNMAHPDDLRLLPHEWVPSAVFSNPQIASVGARSQDLKGRRYVEATQYYSDTAYGWAIQDHDGVCKLYADPESGTLLGAHILGYQASLLITPLIQAVTHGQRVVDIARGQYWIHPALSEVVENALLKLGIEQEVRSGQAH